MQADIDAFAKIDISLGRVNRKLDEMTALQRAAYQAVAPVVGKVPFGGVVPASGFLVLPGGGINNGPDQGNMWHVRSLVIGGTDPSATVTGRVDVFAAGSDYRQATALSQLGLADWRDDTATLPNVAFYGKAELVLQPPEKIWIVVSGATSGQQIQGCVYYVNYQLYHSTEVQWT